MDSALTSLQNVYPSQLQISVKSLSQQHICNLHSGLLTNVLHLTVYDSQKETKMSSILVVVYIPHKGIQYFIEIYFKFFKKKPHKFQRKNSNDSLISLLSNVNNFRFLAETYLF